MRRNAARFCPRLSCVDAPAEDVAISLNLMRLRAALTAVSGLLKFAALPCFNFSRALLSSFPQMNEVMMGLLACNDSLLIRSAVSSGSVIACGVRSRITAPTF